MLSGVLGEHPASTAETRITDKSFFIFFVLCVKDVFSGQKLHLVAVFLGFYYFFLWFRLDAGRKKFHRRMFF